MGQDEHQAISLTPARTGRQRSRAARFRPQELVRVEVRLPATTAARLYQRASDTRRPVSATAAELLDTALGEIGGDPGN